METMVLERGGSQYIVNAAKVLRSADELEGDRADLLQDNAWEVGKGSPFMHWISGDFAEADNPNSNKQFWTAGDLRLGEYSILHAPLNMVHRFRQPVGFFAGTKTVDLKKKAEDDAKKVVSLKEKTERKGSMKIQALAGMWTHIFPTETAMVEAADEAGLLFYSMECRGTHLICGSDEAAGIKGCGEKFDYMAIDTHCEHLLERSSIRHIVKPTFRGGALIVPPVRPGWKNANASVLSTAVMQEAASFAEQNEEQYKSLDAAGGMTASAWEQLMGLVIASTQR